MILEFSVKNYRSIKDLQTISFMATGLKSPDSQTDANNIVHTDSGLSVLKTIGIYGANASGKSNIMKALCRFMEAIGTASSQPSEIAALCEPNLFNEDKNEGSYFQIVMLIDNKKYRYGFVVKKNPQNEEEQEDSLSYSPYIVESEWLFGMVEKNMKCLFLRNGMSVENNLPVTKKVVIPTNLPYMHSLFLNHAAAFDNNGIPSQICLDFSSRFLCNDSLSSNLFRGLSITFAKRDVLKDRLLSLMSSFNLKYEDIIFTGKEDDERLRAYPLDKLFMVKKLPSGEAVQLNLLNQESSGTQKIFDLAGILSMIFDKYNQSSFVIALDEIDDKFHPSLLIKLIGMFNDPSLNRSNTQLIFTSHDTNLLSPSIMRRDQFYFTEKQQDDTTRLYSLADLRGIRNDADFAKQYLAGFYGATPILSKYTMEEKNDE